MIRDQIYDYLNRHNSVGFINVPFVLTATGTGAGVAQMDITVSGNMALTLDGTARFYTDAAGTLGESTTWTAYAGDRSMYIKCPSGTANLIIKENTNYARLTKWRLWTSGNNAPNLSGDIAGLVNATVISIYGNNTLSGDVALLVNTTELRVHSNTTLHGDITDLTQLTVIALGDGQITPAGGNTVTGSITGLTNLLVLEIAGSNTTYGDISALTSLTRLNHMGNNTITGDVTGLVDLEFLECWGQNTLYGSVSALTKLTYLQIFGSNTVTGSITNLVDLYYVYGTFVLSGSVSGLSKCVHLELRGENTIEGDVAGMPLIGYLWVAGSNTLTGTVEGLTDLFYLWVDGANTISGSIAALTDLIVCKVSGSNTMTYPNVTHLPSLCWLYIHTSVTLTAANVNQLLADIWANRDDAKPYYYRNIDLRGNVASEAPTGQGLIDKAALQAYRTPNNVAGNALWTVLTR